MNEKIIETYSKEIADEGINKKVFTGISGMIKIICGVLLGLVLSIYGLAVCMANISSMSKENIINIIIFIIFVISIAGYIWLIVRGAFQITSIFKSVNENTSFVFGADIIALICIAASFIGGILSAADYVLTYGANMIIINIYLVMYVVSVVITLIDAISIKRNKKIS